MIYREPTWVNFLYMNYSYIFYLFLTFKPFKMNIKSPTHLFQYYNKNMYVYFNRRTFVSEKFLTQVRKSPAYYRMQIKCYQLFVKKRMEHVYRISLIRCYFVLDYGKPKRKGYVISSLCYLCLFVFTYVLPKHPN